jgi:hypothetical protein
MIVIHGECVRCRTVMTVMLTVMSDIEPHMISGNLGMRLDIGWELVSLVV